MTSPALTGPGGSVRQAAPWWGRQWEHQHAVVAGIGSMVACAGYVLAVRVLWPDAAPGWVEAAATATSLWAVWITQRRNVLASRPASCRWC